MKITIITGGSRGDVQPYVALGVGLKKLGYFVCMPAPEIFRDLITESGLQYIETKSVNPQEFANSFDMQESAKNKNKLKFIRTMFNELKPMMENIYNETMEVCKGSDAIISTLAILGVYSIAEKLGIPCIFSMLFPVHRTSEYPSALVPHFFNFGIYNKFTHTLTEQLIWQPFRSINNN